MKTIEIIGFKRANLGKKESKDLRLDSNVPCVLYGGKEQVHFHAPMFLFRDLVYSPNAYKVDLTIEGSKTECILQDIQFHPVNEMILHADFLVLHPDKPVKMEIPVRVSGAAPGVQKGGKLYFKLKRVKIKALPKDLPEAIEIDVSNLELGKSIKVGEIIPKNFAILNNKNLPLVSVEVPRALKSGPEETAAAAPEAAAGAAPAAEAKAPEKKAEKK